jgi:hypothetical protein
MNQYLRSEKQSQPKNKLTIQRKLSNQKHIRTQIK